MGVIFSKGSGLNDSIYGKSQDPIKQFILKENELAEKKSQIANIFNIMPTHTFSAKFGYLTSKGDMVPVGEGGAYPQTEQQEGYSKVIEPDTFKSKFVVTQEMVEDGTMFDVKKEASSFVTQYHRTREKFGAAILNNGISTSMTFGSKAFTISCADALALFSTAHTSITGETGNQSNYYNAEFSYDNLCWVEEKMQKLTDDNGEYIDLQPDTIIIPNNARIKKLVSDAVWGEKGVPDTANNSFNYQAVRWNVINWNYLSNTTGITSGYDSWYLADSRRLKLDGLMWTDRIGLEVKSWVDDDTDNNVWGGRARFAAAPVNWRGIILCAKGLGTTLT
jgi:hypothetical protein